MLGVEGLVDSYLGCCFIEFLAWRFSVGIVSIFHCEDVIFLRSGWVSMICLRDFLVRGMGFWSWWVVLSVWENAWWFWKGREVSIRCIEWFWFFLGKAVCFYLRLRWERVVIRCLSSGLFSDYVSCSCREEVYGRCLHVLSRLDREGQERGLNMGVWVFDWVGYLVESFVKCLSGGSNIEIINHRGYISYMHCWLRRWVMAKWGYGLESHDLMH